jgi:hypothetical protein
VTAPADPGLTTPDPAIPRGGGHRISEFGISNEALIAELPGGRAIVYCGIRRPGGRRKVYARIPTLVEILDTPAGSALVVANHPFNAQHRRLFRRGARNRSAPTLIPTLRDAQGNLIASPLSTDYDDAGSDLDPQLDGRLPSTAARSPPAPDSSGALVSPAS